MLGELACGASKVFENAADLYHEASTLHADGALSRALFLYQISLEECAKIEMLGAWAVSVLTGTEVGIQKVVVAFASHKAKNYANAYSLPATSSEADARSQKRWDEAMKAFKQKQTDFHLQSNSAKNASLYVDFQNGTFAAPKDRISESMVKSIAQTNKEFLASAQTKTKMMTHWLKNFDEVKNLMNGLTTLLEERITQSKDPEEAISAIMDEILTRAKQTGYYKAMTEQIRSERDTANGSIAK